MCFELPHGPLAGGVSFFLLPDGNFTITLFRMDYGSEVSPVYLPSVGITTFAVYIFIAQVNPSWQYRSVTKLLPFDM